jgi:hypothetical protein
MQLAGPKDYGWGILNRTRESKLETPVISETSRFWSHPGQTSQ